MYLSCTCILYEEDIRRSIYIYIFIIHLSNEIIMFHRDEHLLLDHWGISAEAGSNLLICHQQWPLYGNEKITE